MKHSHAPTILRFATDDHRRYQRVQAGGLTYELRTYPGRAPALPDGSIVSAAIDGLGGCVVLAPIGEVPR